MRFKKNKKREEKEKCVLCGKILEITKNTDITDREHYIEGAGQLCKECYQRRSCRM